MNGKIKITAVILFATAFIHVHAQKNKLQTAYSALNIKELDRAKEAIDLAAEHAETKGDAKTWYYRGKIYLAINDNREKFKDLDPESAEKAYMGFLKCLQLDKDGVYKKNTNNENNADGLLIMCAVRVFNKASIDFNNKDFEGAARHFSELYDAFVYDKEKSLPRSNITNESLTYNLYRVYLASGNKAKAKEYLQKLIDIKYKSPDIYLDMSQLYFEEKDTAKGISYIDMGRNLFDDNMDIINAEIRVYVAQGKMDVLLEKVTKAIVSAPDNEVLQWIQAKVYEQKGELTKAEEGYKKAIEIKPDYFDALYNLGALYFNNGVAWNNKASNLPLNASAKMKEYDANAEKEFSNSLLYFEKALTVNDVDRTLLRALKQLYLRRGESDKAKQMDEKLNIKK